MKIAIYSDLHLEFAPFEPPADLDADVVVLAGDIHSPGVEGVSWAASQKAFGRRTVIHVSGNHEFYDGDYLARRRMMGTQALRTDIKHLQMRGVVVNGVRFLGTTLWTDFELPVEVAGTPMVDRDQAMTSAAQGLNDFALIRVPVARGNPRRRELTPADLLDMHAQERAWLAATLLEPFEGPTVVVTHHAPRLESVPLRQRDSWHSPSYANHLPDEFFAVPCLWVHGHIHESADYNVRNCRIVCNPRGYPRRLRTSFDNAAFDPRLVVEI